MQFLKVALVLLVSARVVTAQSTGAFTATGNLTRLRQFHTATLLTNGKVLITGGFAVNGSLSLSATAELYDPATGSFAATGNMNAARYMHTATLLPEGKVLIAGGNNSIAGGCLCDPMASAELYDPVAGTFTATGEMTTARSGHTATLLNDGKVLMAGGPVNHRSQSAEVYDPTTGTFTATGAMAATRAIRSSWPTLPLHSRQHSGKSHRRLSRE